MAKYSDARNVQLVIALLKKYGIRNVIASPGTTNVPFVYSVQNDSFSEYFLLLTSALQHIWLVVLPENQESRSYFHAQVPQPLVTICQV